MKNNYPQVFLVSEDGRNSSSSYVVSLSVQEDQSGDDICNSYKLVKLPILIRFHLLAQK